MTACPHCGAANAEAATWCTQCFASMAAAPKPAPPTSATTAATSHRGDSGLRRGADGLEWDCVACGRVNPIAADPCVVCGTPFTDRFTQDRQAPSVDWEAARRMSLVLPGLGHLHAGDGASGAARLVLFSVWALGGVTVLLGSGMSGMTVAGPLLLGALAVHIATQRDLAALRTGGLQVLAGRVLLWLVVAVTAGTLIGAALGIGISAGTGAAPPSS